MPLMELCSRMRICVSIWTLPQMTSHLCLLILSSLAVSSELGLEDVFFSPQDQTVREGEGVFFQCVSGESSAPASITWLKDGTLITRGRHIQGEYGGGNQKKTSGTLHLFNVTLEDEGLYTCVTHNPLLNISKKSKPAKLTVQEVPRRLQFIRGPDSITVAIGTEVSMHCAVRGFPVPMVHWFKDGCLLSNCSASFSVQNNGQLLTFSNVTREHEGSFHCEASNHKETIKSHHALLLTADMDWSFVQQPANQTVKRGENVTVTCRPPYSRPAAQVAWFKNNQLVSPKGHQIVLPSGDLIFYSVQEDDNGSYFCRASNIHLQRFLTSRRATLTVLAPPSVKLRPQVLTVAVGARVVLECEVSGYPPPSISWVKRGHSKQTGGKIVLGLRNATLYINSARGYDEGAYVCEASNTLGHSRNTAMLRVAVSPIILTFVDRVSCRIGGAVDLPCMAVGIQPITYSWTRGKAETYSPISPTEDRHINAEDGALHISNVQYTDMGEYFCTAENRAGRHQKRSILAVTAEHRPADSGKQTRLVLSASTNTSKDLPVFQSSDSMAKQHLGTTRNPHEQAKQHEAACSLPRCDPTTNGTPTSPPFLMGAVAELKMPARSLGWFLQHKPNQPTTSPTQPLVTQMQPPMLLPPPHPNFQSGDIYSPLQQTRAPLMISKSEPQITFSQTSVVANKALGATLKYVLTESLRITSPHTHFQQQVSDELLIKTDPRSSNIRAVSIDSQTTRFTEMSNISLGEPFGFLKKDSYSPTTTESPVTQTKMTHSGSVIQSSASKAELGQTKTQRLTTKSKMYQPYHEPTSTHISQTKPQHQSQPPHQKTHLQPSPAISQISESDMEQPFTQSLYPKYRLKLWTIPHYLPTSQSPTSPFTKHQKDPIHSQSTSTMSLLHSSPTQHPLLYSQSPLAQTETFTLQNKNHTSILTVHRTSDLLEPKNPQVSMSDQVQLNTSQQGDPVQSTKSGNESELTELLKRNTSQSPMTSNDPRVTQQSPSWLPVLEKHDIPIVVGVGVSLAFIFITVTFYSVVQKNEAAPTIRAGQRSSDASNVSTPNSHSEHAQRNLGVPIRHTECRAEGRSYENRAFEDDDCVTVIEQSPNTSDTRALPPGLSLVTVQMEPTFEDLQEDTHPALDDHSVTVETYPEPILDTKIDPSLEEVKGRSLSQPSIQLQCAEDWTSNRGDNRCSPCHNVLPPPSSLPSRSPSPSPPSRHQDGLRSSLTLQTAEAGGAPIHHSLSISHGNHPLLLSHHVSLGLTTVAVDVHFYPAATASVAVGTSTHINSASNSTSVAAPPVFSSPFVSSQENDQSAARIQQFK
ncbi:mucin-2 [Eleginops maclovinus]|uniref:mucin-2 n=1 Tax=Eleginops maclovinus TaxID=56733 RepID=UPI00307FE226